MQCIIESVNTQDNTQDNGGARMKNYQPPFQITNAMLTYVASISEKTGKITATSNLSSKPHLRKNNQIKSIHSSLKIEANSLSIGQVRDIIDGKTVLGEPKEIQTRGGRCIQRRKMYFYGTAGETDLAAYG